MKSIRREVGYILGQQIPFNGWEKSFDELNKQGRIDMQKVIEILVIYGKRLEELEVESS